MSRSGQPLDLKKTVKVSNISKLTYGIDIKEFFSFSSEILYVEMQRESENTQVVYITYKDSHGADTAILLTAAMQKFTMKIVSMMKGEKLYHGQGGPIILSQVQSLDGYFFPSSFRSKAKEERLDPGFAAYGKRGARKAEA
uniref:Uncharacterized protein n=1 Tax=Cucumis melo TaxID=3656 RepID=A0A9I9EGI5_CUCME